MQYVVIDVETTGGSPKDSKIIELSMFKVVDSKIVDEYTSLVDPECDIPQFIERFTGITNAMVVGAPKFHEIAEDVLNFTEGCVFVAHNAAFDYGMYRREFLILGYDFRRSQLCTVRASRAVIPGHESYSLGKLTKALGIGLQGRHRARGDAEATAQLFLLLEKTDSNQLAAFLQVELDPMILHPDLDIATLEDLPSKTGIYKFYNDARQLIYVGKSKNIKKKIDQNLRNVKTKSGLEMRSEIAKITTKVTGNELIANLTEHNLIQEFNPTFNKPVKSTSNFGLFDNVDAQGFLRFTISKLSENTAQPMRVFATKKKAIDFLTSVSLQHNLQDSVVQQEEINLFSVLSDQQNGTTTPSQEEILSYNARAERMYASLKLKHPHFFIIEEGRNRSEKCIVYVKNSTLVGWGFVPYYLLNKDLDQWIEAIEPQQSDATTEQILRDYLKNIRDGRLRLV